jgi:hypothetical protein
MTRALRTIAVACMVIALAGCGTAAAAGRAGDGQLIRDVANRLTQADSLVYTASFSLADNATVTIAHALNPERTAYSFPGGLVLLLPDRTTSCKITKTSAKCTDGSHIAPATDSSSSVDSTVEQGGMIRPQSVVALLNQTASNADAIVADTDRTLAGTSATCISVTGVPADDQFSACVTADGLLGAFTGTIEGRHLDLVLDHFEMTTETTAFDLPRGS